MLTAPDFSKKQIVVVMFSEGEKLAVSNDNLAVKTKDGKIRFQTTCYRIFLVVAVGNCSLTSVVIRQARKFNFFIALMTSGFRLYALIGAEKEGNFLLHKKQYAYDGLDIAKVIVKNKIHNQNSLLKSVRNKSDAVKEAIQYLNDYSSKADTAVSINELMAYEGLASKIYFKNHFNNVMWQGRQPRLKRDYINSSLDVGYTLLFSFIDSLLESYGFDVYCGIFHRQFYMRKSLVCDMVEPFRPIIDHTVKKAINLKQIKPEDFILINNQYQLQWKESPRYVKLFMEPILERKDGIFLYIKDYYRSFMKDAEISDYPFYDYTED